MPTDIASIEELGVYDSPDAVGWLGWIKYRATDGESKLGFIDLKGIFIPFAATNPDYKLLITREGLYQFTVDPACLEKQAWKRLRKQIIEQRGR